jgi:hypothetical protein
MTNEETNTATRWQMLARWSLKEISDAEYVVWLRAQPDYDADDEFFIKMIEERS